MSAKPLIYLQCDGENPRTWNAAFAKYLSQYQVVTSLENINPLCVEYFAGWLPPQDLLTDCPNLKAILNLGAGIEHLEKDTAVNTAIASGKLGLARVVDGGMGQQIGQYISYGALHFSRCFHIARHHQQQANWDQHPYPEDPRYRVGILGFGTLGKIAAKMLLHNGFDVSAWSRRQQSFAGVDCFHAQDGLDAFLQQIDLLACVLPGGSQTHNFINQERLAKLRRGAAVINCGRGSCLDVDALVSALDSDHLSGALLDVFALEPLPAGDPLWSNPKLIITPHIAARTLAEPAVMQFAQYINQQNK